MAYWQLLTSIGSQTAIHTWDCETYIWISSYSCSLPVVSHILRLIQQESIWVRWWLNSMVWVGGGVSSWGRDLKLRRREVLPTPYAPTITMNRLCSSLLICLYLLLYIYISSFVYRGSCKHFRIGSRMSCLLIHSLMNLLSILFCYYLDQIDSLLSRFNCHLVLMINHNLFLFFFKPFFYLIISLFFCLFIN